MGTGLFTDVERTIVDWFEASHLFVEERNGEWFFVTDQAEVSLTELATAVAAKVAALR